MGERFRDDANMRMKQTFTRIIPFQDLHIIKKTNPPLPDVTSRQSSPN